MRSGTAMTVAVIVAPIGLLTLMMGDGNVLSWIGGVLLAIAVAVGFAQGFWRDSKGS